MTRLWRAATNGADETFELGRALGGTLRGGDFVALIGALGAGKTQLVKGIAAGLEVADDEPVVSPTFVLVREYAGRLKLYHIDAYRLGSAEDLWALGVEEMMSDSPAVVVLEWADRAPEIVPSRACRIDLEHAGPTHRRISVSWNEARLAEFVSRV